MKLNIFKRQKAKEEQLTLEVDTTLEIPKKIRFSTKVAYSILCNKYKLAYIFCVLCLFSLCTASIYYLCKASESRFSYAMLLLSNSSQENQYIQSTLMPAFITAWLYVIFVFLAIIASIACLIILIKVLRITNEFSKRKINIRPLSKKADAD